MRLLKTVVIVLGALPTALGLSSTIVSSTRIRASDSDSSIASRFHLPSRTTRTMTPSMMQRQEQRRSSCRLKSALIKDDVSTTTTTTAPPSSSQSSSSSSSSSPPVESSSTKNYLDDGFIFGLDGSGLERPKGKEAQLVVEGDSLETKPWQQAVVWGTLLGHVGFLVRSFTGMLAINQGHVIPALLQAVVLLVSSWILADFGSGVLHWSVDNYGNGRTPIMGGIIAAFQGHHSAPWTITERGFANNVYKLCVPFGVVTVGLISLLVGPFTTFFMTVFCAMEILSQEFHKWSHTTKRQVPRWVNTLQDVGLTIGRKPHAQHHIAPYDGNYCIISGVCNTWLDQSGFFRRLEHVVYQWNGVESNAWKLDEALRERTLQGNYGLPKQP